MSVCFFGAEELGNAAAFLVREPHQPHQHPGDLEWLAGLFAAYSTGNAAAFNFRYSDGTAKGIPAREILEAARAAQKKLDPQQARGTIGLLSYNGPEGEGLETFRGSLLYRKAMVLILARAFSKVNRMLEDKERGRGWQVGFGEGQD